MLSLKSELVYNTRAETTLSLFLMKWSFKYIKYFFCRGRQSSWRVISICTLNKNLLSVFNSCWLLWCVTNWICFFLVYVLSPFRTLVTMATYNFLSFVVLNNFNLFLSLFLSVLAQDCLSKMTALHLVFLTFSMWR